MLKKLVGIVVICLSTASLNCMQQRTPEQQALRIIKHWPKSLRQTLRCSIATLLQHPAIPTLHKSINEYLVHKITLIDSFFNAEDDSTRRVLQELATQHIYPNNIELLWQRGSPRKFFLFLDRLSHIAEEYLGVYLRIYCCKCYDGHVFNDQAIQLWLEGIILPKTTLDTFSEKAQQLARTVNFEILRMAIYKHCAQEVVNQLQAFKSVSPTALEHEHKQSDCSDKIKYGKAKTD